MKKSLYSLLLYDDLVAALDRVGYTMNISRSNLINQIIADYLSMQTPHGQRRDIFDELARLMVSKPPFRVQSDPTDSMMSVYSRLQYRYNPTIRYCIELSKDGDIAEGVLRVTTRTQSNELLEALKSFFTLWKNIENYCLGGNVHSELSEGRFERSFSLKDKKIGSSSDIAEAISGYINILHNGLSNYLSGGTERELLNLYQNYISEQSSIS
ncbi:MAG: hypothetical protein Q8865_00795 [Bacillota bacterium]|nr:hypothetical protein [Bacillota bacterium]